MKEIFKKWWLSLILIIILGCTGYFGSTDCSDNVETTIQEIVFQAEENQEMVWISDFGKKYHSNPECSNMKKPSKISKLEAVNRGREPCSKCY